MKESSYRTRSIKKSKERTEDENKGSLVFSTIQT
jgi:hypothetical protein